MESRGFANPLSPERDLHRLREMQRQGRHAEALNEAQALLRDRSDDRELALIAAIALRNLGRVEEALAALDALQKQQPRFSRLHQERGLCFVAARRPSEAADAFSRAVSLNTALPASWSMLESLRRAAGDETGAAQAAAQLAMLKRLPLEVLSATSLFSDGDVISAERIVRTYLQCNADHPEALRLLGPESLRQTIFLDDAERLLERALALAPDYRAARFDYADVLARRHKFRAAQEQIERLLAETSRDPDCLALAAAIAAGLGEHETAVALYRGLIAISPPSPEIHLALAHTLRTAGDIEGAIAEYRTAAAIRPDFGDAWWSLANLKTYRFSEDEIARMREQEAAPATSPSDRAHLSFALGKAYEDKKEIAASWEHYTRGNALMRAESRYDSHAMQSAAGRAGRDLQARIFRAPCRLGGIRAGPDLRSRAAALRLHAHRADPRFAFTDRGHAGAGRHSPDRARPAKTCCSLSGRAGKADEGRRSAPGRGAILADTRVYRSGKPYFIDKMPNNFGISA